MNKKVLIIGGLVLFLLLIAGGALLALNNSSSQDVEEEEGILEEDFVELSAEDVGLSLALQQNNQQLVMELTDLSEVESFDYEVNYDAVENGETVARGTFGSGPNEDERGEETIHRVIDLGTCSSGVCRYDKGVEVIEFSLRVNLTNGEVGLVEEAVTLE